MMRVRFLSLLSALVLLGLAAVPAQAREDRGGGGDGGGYLALGDSVPFGFSPLLNAKDADNFVGYPEIVAQRLDLRDVNATCPGEATGGFLSLAGTDNVCRPYRFVANDPLHVRYRTSQMAFALSYLRAHRHNTRLVTLTLGANDVFRFQKDCAAGATVGTCPLGLGGVAATMQANLNTILGRIRATGYAGLIMAVTYYSLDYHDVSGSVFLNGPMKAAAAAHGALIADGLAAWAPAAAGGSSCVAGLLIVTSNSPLVCGVHPTPKGRDLLATAVVNTVAASCAAHDAEECLGERD